MPRAGRASCSGEATLRRGVLSAGLSARFMSMASLSRCGAVARSMPFRSFSAAVTAAARRARSTVFDSTVCSASATSASGVGQQLAEPDRDLTTARLTRCRRRRRRWRLLGGEVAALRDGGDVGPVNSEDAFEDVAGLGDVI